MALRLGPGLARGLAPRLAPGLARGLRAVVALPAVAALSVVAVGALADLLRQRATYYHPPQPEPESEPESEDDEPEPDLTEEILMEILNEYMERRITEAMVPPEAEDPYPTNVEPYCGARGPLTHDSRGMFPVQLRLKDKHEWSGHFRTGPPQNARKGKAGDNSNVTDDIVHLGAPPKGSKAGVAYAVQGHQWIVAWHVPLGSAHNQNKIYVEAGPESLIDWSRIERKLDASSNKSFFGVCLNGAKKPKALAAATISNGSNATIAAAFFTH